MRNPSNLDGNTWAQLDTHCASGNGSPANYFGDITSVMFFCMKLLVCFRFRDRSSSATALLNLASKWFWRVWFWRHCGGLVRFTLSFPKFDVFFSFIHNGQKGLRCDAMP